MFIDENQTNKGAGKPPRYPAVLCQTTRTGNMAGWKPGLPQLVWICDIIQYVMLESGLQIGGLHKVSITAAKPDVVGGIETQCGDICLECGKFYPRLTKLMQIFQMRVIPWANVPPAAYFKGSNRGVCCSDEMCIFI